MQAVSNVTGDNSAANQKCLVDTACRNERRVRGCVVFRCVACVPRLRCAVTVRRRVIGGDSPPGAATVYRAASADSNANYQPRHQRTQRPRPDPTAGSYRGPWIVRVAVSVSSANTIRGHRDLRHGAAGLIHASVMMPRPLDPRNNRSGPAPLPGKAATSLIPTRDNPQRFGFLGRYR